MKPKRLHEYVAERLRSRIRKRHAAGDRLDSLPTLATDFEVSINTVRAALGVLSEEGLVESRHGSGVFVADYMEKLPIGVVCELDVSYPGQSGFWLSVIQSVRRQLQKCGFRERPYLGHTRPTHPLTGALVRPTCLDFLDDLRNDNLRGVVSITNLRHPEYEKAFKKHPVPAVNTGLPGAPAPQTNEDDILAQIIRRLVAVGRRKIAIMGLDYKGHLSTSFQKVSKTLEDLALDIPDKWIRDDIHPIGANGAGWEEFREIWSASREKPDALLVLDDILFKDAALAISELGIDVPDQLHVTVHVNRGHEPYSPFPIDRIVMDPEKYAARLVEDLTRLLDGNSINPEPIECVTAEYQRQAHSVATAQC